jgi:hypothetical protein
MYVYRLVIRYMTLSARLHPEKLIDFQSSITGLHRKWSPGTEQVNRLQLVAECGLLSENSKAYMCELLGSGTV